MIWWWWWWWWWGWSYDEETHPTDNGLMNKQSQFSLSCALILLVVHVQLVHVGNRSFQNLVRKYTCSFVSVFVSGIWLEFDQISHRTFWTAVKEYLSVYLSLYLYLYFLCHLDLYLYLYFFKNFLASPWQPSEDQLLRQTSPSQGPGSRGFEPSKWH